MKKSKILFTLFLIGLFVSILTISVNASVSAPNKTVQSGENVSITITSTTALESFDIKCEDDGGLKYKSCSSSATGAVVNSSGKKISYAAVGGTKTLGTYNFTAPTVTEEKKYTVKFDVDGTTVSSVVTVKPKTTNVVDNNKNTETKKSNNANLKTLGVTPKEYDFSGFSKNKTDYSVTVPSSVNSLKVTAIAEDSKKAKVSISGNSGFEVGSGNKIKVTVTAEDGTTKIYNIKVTKLATEEEKPGNVINEEEKLVLKSLTIEGIILSPEFSSDIYSYTANLEEDLSEVTVNGVASESDAKIEVTGNTNLIDGENIIKVKVTSNDGKSTVTYQITLNKGVTDLAKNEEKSDTTLNFGKKAVRIIVVTIIAIIICITIITILLVKENKRLKNLNNQEYNDEQDNDEIRNLNDIPRTEEKNKESKRGGKHF